MNFISKFKKVSTLGSADSTTNENSQAVKFDGQGRSNTGASTAQPSPEKEPRTDTRDSLFDRPIREYNKQT